jgi:hypothetical protein
MSAKSLGRKPWFSRVITSVGVMAMVGAMSMTSASAATNPYTPEAICGSGFAKVKPYAITVGGETVATTWVMYNKTSGYNCVTTVKSRWVGEATLTGAYLKVSDGDPGFEDPTQGERGYFKYYAVAPKVRAPGMCIDFWGLASSPAGTQGQVYRYNVHCGA